MGYENRIITEWGGKSRVVIQNPSINGNTTRMALERMPYDLQSHEPDIVVVTFGMNDCNYWVTDKGLPRVSKEAFEANMKEIIDRCYNFGAKHVLIHTNHLSPREDIMTGTDFTYNESNMHYNEIIRKVRNERKQAQFIDIEKIMLQMIKVGENSIADFTQPDGIHLSDIGNEVYYDAFFPEIMKRVTEIGG